MGCSKQITSCGKLPQVVNTDHRRRTGMCWLYQAALASTPPRGCRAQHDGPSARSPPRWGRLFAVDLKKSLRTERAGVCSAEKFGSHQSTHRRSGGVAASCWWSGEGYSPKPERLHNCFDHVFVVVIRHEIAALIQGLHSLWQGEDVSHVVANASFQKIIPMGFEVVRTRKDQWKLGEPYSEPLAHPS